MYVAITVPTVSVVVVSPPASGRVVCLTCTVSPLLRTPLAEVQAALFTWYSALLAPPATEIVVPELMPVMVTVFDTDRVLASTPVLLVKLKAGASSDLAPHQADRFPRVAWQEVLRTRPCLLRHRWAAPLDQLIEARRSCPGVYLFAKPLLRVSTNGLTSLLARTLPVDDGSCE